MLLLELQGRQVRETGVKRYDVVVLAPSFNDEGDLSAQLRIHSTFSHSSRSLPLMNSLGVLPLTSRVDVRRADGSFLKA